VSENQERDVRRKMRGRSRTAGVLVLERIIKDLYHRTAHRVKEKVWLQIP